MPAPPPNRPSRRPVELVVLIATVGWISWLPSYPGWIGVASNGWRPLAFALSAALGLVVLARRTVRGTPPGDGPPGRLWSWRDAPLGILAAGLLAGVFTPTHQELAWRMYVHMVLLVAAFYTLGKALALDRALRGPIAATIALFSGTVALCGILEVLAGVNPVYEYLWQNPFYEVYRSFRRPLATQFNPAPLGTYLVLSLPFAVFAAREPGWRRTVFSTVVALDVACLVLTLSRGPVLALVAMWIGLQVLRRKPRRLAAGLALAAAVMAVAPLLPGDAARLGFERVLFGYNGIFSPYRYERLEMASKMFADHPLDGAGFRQFTLQFERYRPGDEEIALKVADNMYLTLLAETGLAGTAAFALFFAAAFRRCRGVVRGSPAGGRPWGLTLFATLVGLAVSFGHYEVLYISGPAAFFSLLCGLVAGTAEARAPATPAGGP